MPWLRMGMDTLFWVTGCAVWGFIAATFAIFVVVFIWELTTRKVARLRDENTARIERRLMGDSGKSADPLAPQHWKSRKERTPND